MDAGPLAVFKAQRIGYRRQPLEASPSRGPCPWNEPGQQSFHCGQSQPKATAESRQQQAPAPQQSSTTESRKEKAVSETEEKLRQERAARAERARQMMERARSLDERLRDQPAPQASQQQSVQQNLQRQCQQQSQQMHEQARRGVRARPLDCFNSTEGPHNSALCGPSDVCLDYSVLSAESSASIAATSLSKGIMALSSFCASSTRLL